MLAELIAAGEADDEGSWYLSLAGVSWGDQKLGDGGANLEVHVRLHLEHGGPSSTWTIRCGFVLDYRFQHASLDPIEHVTDQDHPLLSRYRDRHGTLFFRGAAPPARDVIASLWEEHRAACGPWISLDDHLREDAAAVLAAGHGLLASGPVAVLERYAAVLERHGVEPSIVGDQAFTEWRGGKWQPRERPAEALLLGKSFVVADSFAVERR